MTSLRTKLSFGFGGLLLILVVVSALSMAVLTRYSHALERLFRENYDSAVYCDAMKESLDQLDARAQHRVWGETAATAAPLQARFEDNLRRQLDNCTLPGERALTDHLAQLWDEYKTRYGRLDAPGAADLYHRDLVPRYQELRQVAQRIADMNMSNMVSVDGQVKTTLVDVRDTLLVLVVAGTLLAVAVVWAVGATIVRPLMMLTRCARQIESGNLDFNVEVKSRDEIGHLADAFNAMAGRLREFRRRDNERLARTEQTTQLAIDSLPDAVCVIGADDRIEIANRTAQEHLGIRPGLRVDAIALPWLSELYDRVKSERQHVEPPGYKSALQLFDHGQERFLLPRAVPMFDADHKPIGVTVILVDVTRLRQADEMKSSMVSTVSHELRTPLTSVRMALLMLKQDPTLTGLSATQRRLLTAACEDTERLYRIIENLLNMSRLESGRAQFQFRPTAARDIVSQAVDPLRQAFTDKRLRLETALSADPCEVMADGHTAVSALTNLLSNALKFTPGGGQVRIELAAEARAVWFRVADSGPGIPPQYTRRIFDKFFRVPNPESPGGAGLGLAIAKEIVEAHGGHIEYHPRHGGGSVFAFSLPRAARA